MNRRGISSTSTRTASTPFTELPRDYDAALVKFGAETLTRNGLLPWRTAEMAGNLGRAFQSQSRGNSYAASDIKFFSAIVGHYVARRPRAAARGAELRRAADGAERRPLSRFEEDLFVRYGKQLNIQPPPLTVDPERARFHLRYAARELPERRRRCSPRIARPSAPAIRTTIATTTRSSRRSNRCWKSGISQAISGVASVITSEWERAGRPALPVNPPPRPPARGAAPPATP